MQDRPKRHYHAFISYSHADNRAEGRRWANWLHEGLESYEVPAELVGNEGPDGRPVPESLFPIFRDEDELSAKPNLAVAIESALNRSEWLVVICSPRSAASPYVNDEVRVFKELGKGQRILALIIDGSPGTASGAGHECFPTALRAASTSRCMRNSASFMNVKVTSSKIARRC